MTHLVFGISQTTHQRFVFSFDRFGFDRVFAQPVLLPQARKSRALNTFKHSFGLCALIYFVFFGLLRQQGLQHQFLAHGLAQLCIVFKTALQLLFQGGFKRHH